MKTAAYGHNKRPARLAGLLILWCAGLLCWMPVAGLAAQAAAPVKHKPARQVLRAAARVEPVNAPAVQPVKPVKSATPVAESALSADELAIAQQVQRGLVACELGVNVRVTEDIQAPGHFEVQSSKYRFRMTPVATSTGAIRLEDRQAGAVWLQLPHKSMLMSQKLGSRLADACVTPAQAQIAMALEKSPPPSLLEPSPVSLVARQSTQ